MTGTVTDTQDEPMIGVNITVKDVAGLGTITDINGNFSIKMEPYHRLVFSYIGYDDVEVLVKATGNIIVLGQLKGMAHAGCKGMTDAFVTAVYMAPVQLRIADIITRFPEENKHGPKPPEYAFVKDGQIFVMALS